MADQSVLCLTLGPAHGSQGSNPYGSILGHSKDASDADIVGASVKVINKNTTLLNPSILCLVRLRK